MRKQIATLFTGIIIGALAVFLFGRLTPINPTSALLKIVSPDGKGSVELSIEGESINYQKILDSMFSDDFLNHGVRGWLREQQQIYRIDEEAMAAAIENDLCEEIPKEPPNLRLQRGRECANKAVPSRLRDLASRRAPPFHHIGLEGRLGYPAQQRHRPQEGFANTCRPGDFYGKRLQIANPQTGTVVEVIATGQYTCTPAVTFPDIQLGEVDVEKLFEGRPLQQLEDIIIVALD